ncbi:MAG: hypothetical protein E7028_10220 [Planctomycetaceae bacterium]|nr:hypothetical protein [Planctomycetaceae bacterium]
MAKPIDFRYHKNRRNFSWAILGIGIVLILSWTLFQKETLTFLFSLNDPNRVPPEWMNQMEDISRPERYLDVLTPDMLDGIKDHAPVSASETKTVMRLWNRLNAMTLEEIRDVSIGRVLFAQYFKQPETYRGNVLRIRGTVRLIQKVEIPNWLKKSNGQSSPETENPVSGDVSKPEKQNTNSQPQKPEQINAENNENFGYDFDTFYELWIQPEDNPRDPVLVNTLNIPENWPVGKDSKIPIVIDGVFFKHYLYEGMEDMESTPCFYAKSPLWYWMGKETPQTETRNPERKTIPLIYVVAGAFIFAGLILRFIERRIKQSIPESEPLPDKIDFP